MGATLVKPGGGELSANISLLNFTVNQISQHSALSGSDLLQTTRKKPSKRSMKELKFRRRPVHLSTMFNWVESIFGQSDNLWLSLVI